MDGMHAIPTGVLRQLAPGLQSALEPQPPQRPPRQRPKGQTRSESLWQGRPAADWGPGDGGLGFVGAGVGAAVGAGCAVAGGGVPGV